MILKWNLNGVKTYEYELLQLIRKKDPDIVVLTETRGDASRTIEKIWPGARTEQKTSVGHQRELHQREPE